MKHFRALSPLLLIPLYTSCYPAGGQVDTTTPMLCYGSLGIIIIMGLIVLGLTISLRKRKPSTAPKDTKARNTTQPRSIPGTSAIEADKSDTNDNIVGNNRNDVDSKVEAIKRYVQVTIPDHQAVQTNGSADFIKANQVIRIQIQPDETKSQAATEIVDVPNGVEIKVTRIRTVDHTINIEWTTALTGKGELGIKELVSASIQGEIQRIKGYASQQTESVEYEVTLNGEKHNQYKLVWMDIWLKGTANVEDSNGSYSQPFQFRDRTELKIVPILDT